MTPQQNYFKQGRRCVIPKTQDNRFIKFDKSNLEFRTVMHLAGFDVKKIDSDAFAWMVSKSNGAFKEAADLLKSDERSVAKTCTYSNLYGEGMILVEKGDFKNPKFQKSVDCGALRLYNKWKYQQYTVAFSGINMAERLFGEATLENRAKANYIVEDVFMKEFPMLRMWQEEVMHEAETGIVHSITGRYIKLYDSPKDAAKVALSFKGQGLGADHVQSVMLRFYYKYGKEGIPLIQVHDELNFEKPLSWTKEEAIEFMAVAEEEDFRIKNFICPVKMYWSTGPTHNWAQMERIK